MVGVLVVDKPAGITSHDVVARARRALGITRIGHTGTLDPFATGVLALVIDRATRLAPLLSGAEKEYVAHVRFGTSTDTYDVTGTRAEPSSAPLPGRQAIEAALEEFRGTFWQMPPPFSAKKIGGVPAYRLARRNKPVELKPASVTVTHLSLDTYDEGVARLNVTSSAGFYVRSLAHDLGQRFGCGACLDALRRTRAGAFRLEDAVPLDTVVQEGPATVERLVRDSDLLMDLPSAVLNERGVRRASHGNALAPEDLILAVHPAFSAPRLRLLDEAGALVGIAEPVPGGLLHPVIVLV